MSPCYFVTLLLCYFVTLLLCYFVTLLLSLLLAPTMPSRNAARDPCPHQANPANKGKDSVVYLVVYSLDGSSICLDPRLFIQMFEGLRV